MAFPEGFVDEVRRSLDMVRLVSDYLPLKKVGASWKGLCPFHQEKTPSFNVRGDFFHCFGCGEGGDGFKFLMLKERVSFPEAVETLARRFGVPLPAERSEPEPERKAREEILSALEAAAAHYERTLWTASGESARAYLLGRGFEKQTLETIRAGAAREGWSDLLDALKRRFSPAILLQAGLVLERSGGHYDRFRGRAIFPILNEAGKVVAFGARSLDSSEPKYLNSPETAVYQKSRTLYGLSWAKEPIRKASRAVLMEGYLDVARAIESGITEAVATCGTALTPLHARLLRRMTASVVVNFDSDEAGRKAARKSLETLEAEGLEAKVVELPSGDDPDTFLKAHGGAAYREQLGQAAEGMRWLIAQEAASNDVTTPSGKAAFLNALLPSLLRKESAVERSAWLKVVVERGGLDAEAAGRDFHKALGMKPPPPPPTPPPPRPKGILPAERFLVALILAEAPGVPEALSELTEDEVSPLRTAEILVSAKRAYLKGETALRSGLSSGLSEEARRILTEIAIEGPPAAGLTPMSCVKELQSGPLKARMAEIQKNLSKASGEALEELLQEKLQLRRRMANL